MDTYQYKTQLQMRTPIGFSVRFGNTTRVICLLLWILFFTAIAPCIAVSQQIDTSEQRMINDFKELMRNSETIVDAKIISKESKWDSPVGRRAIYTLIKFKVFNTIKGVVKNNEFIFEQPGGVVGDTSELVSNMTTYNLNERAIYFFRNNNLKAFLNEERRMPVYGGQIDFGYARIDTFRYFKILKQSVSDTTVMAKYLHSFKLAMQKHNAKDHRLKSSEMPTETIEDSVKHFNHVR